MSDHHHATGNIKIAFFLNLFFSAIELVGGLYTNSVAILSDALHDLGDSLSLGVAWYFQKISGKKSDKHFSYGYKRFSVLGAIINTIVLTVGSVFIFIESTERLFNPVMPDAEGMILFAVAGVLVNGIAAFRLSKGYSINERVVYLHLMEDVLGWLATLIIALILYFKTIPILDPILSLSIAVFILINVVKNLKKSVKIILQGTPEDIEPKKIKNEIESLKGVLDTHDCHIWTLDGQYHILSLHIVVEANQNPTQLIDLKKKIKETTHKLGINHTTLEFELPGEECDPC